MYRLAISFLMAHSMGLMAYGGSFAEIASLPLDEQPAAVAEAYANDALDIGSRTISFKVQVVHELLGRKSNGVYELVSSSDQLFQSSPSESEEWSRQVETFADGRLKTYIFGNKNNGVVSVTIGCGQTVPHGYVERLSQSIGGIPFRENSSTAESYSAFLGGLESEGVRDVPGLGEVLVLMSKRKNSEQSNYLGERFGRLVWLGMDQVTTTQTYTDNTYKQVSDIKNVSRWETRLGHQRLEEFCIPASWKTTLITEYVGADGQPTQPPKLEIERTGKVINASLMDEFPERLLQIHVPPEAKIVDNCEQKEALEMVMEQQQPTSSSPWRWLFGFAGVLCVGYGSYRFLGKRRG